MMLIYLLLVGLILLNGVWLMLVLFGLPGNWLIVIGTVLFAWWQKDAGVFSNVTLIAIVVLAGVGELVEFLSAATGAKRAGASRRSAIGALLGAMAGAIIGTVVISVPVLGTLMGSCIGAGTGAWGLECLSGKGMRPAMRTGFGAGKGQLMGVLGKASLGVLIWVIVAVAAFWP